MSRAILVTDKTIWLSGNPTPVLKDFEKEPEKLFKGGGGARFSSHSQAERFFFAHVDLRMSANK